MAYPAWTRALLLATVVLVAPPAAVGGDPVVVADDFSDDQTPKTPVAERRDADTWLDPQGLTTSTRGQDAVLHAVGRRPQVGADGRRSLPIGGGGWDRFPAPVAPLGVGREEGRRVHPTTGRRYEDVGRRVDAGTNPDYVRYPVDYLHQDATPLFDGQAGTRGEYYEGGHPSLYAMRGGMFRGDSERPEGTYVFGGHPAIHPGGFDVAQHRVTTPAVFYPYVYRPSAHPGPVGYSPEIHARGVEPGKNHDERRVYYVETPVENHNYIGDDNGRYRGTNQDRYGSYNGNGDGYRVDNGRNQDLQRQYLQGDRSRYSQIRQNNHVRPVLPRDGSTSNYKDASIRGSNQGQAPIREYYGSEGNGYPRRYR